MISSSPTTFSPPRGRCRLSDSGAGASESVVDEILAGVSVPVGGPSMNDAIELPAVFLLRVLQAVALCLRRCCAA